MGQQARGCVTAVPIPIADAWSTDVQAQVPLATMSVGGGSPQIRRMDPLSFLPAVVWLVVVPVALGLAFRWLAGDEADDAMPPLSALLMTETRTRPVRGAQDEEFVPWRFDAPRADNAPVDPVRNRPVVTRPSPARAKA